MNKPFLVSAHGGHSGEFCCHAKNTLEQIIKTYISNGFIWAGITEHMPPVSDDFLYPLEIQQGYNAEKIQLRFKQYIKCCKRLKEKYKDQIEILVGFETEAYTGSFAYAKKLIREERPDYIVGSVHHVNDFDLDSSEATYADAIKESGSIEEFYLDYFDLQLDMIQQLKPSVIGHFDIVRIYDPEYKERINNPVIFDKIERNLECIKSMDLSLDYNLKGFLKNAKKPYPTEQILSRAIDIGIKIVPGDDSHGITTVGLNIEKGIELLQKNGASTNWSKPNKISY